MCMENEKDTQETKEQEQQTQETATTGNATVETIEWNGRIHKRSNYSEEHWRFILELVEKDKKRTVELTAKRAEILEKIEKLKKELEIAENEKKKIETEMIEMGILQKETEQKNSRFNGSKRKEQIIEILKTNGSLTQKEIADKLGVTAQAIYASLQSLRANGQIEKNESIYLIKQ